MEFDSTPRLMHPCSALDSSNGIPKLELALLQPEVQTLIHKNAIEGATMSVGFYAHIFTVPTKNGKLRPVFNMKPLNKFIRAHSSRMTTLKMLASAIRRCDYSVSLDLSDAYFHVNVNPSHGHFLRLKEKSFSSRPCLLG